MKFKVLQGLWVRLLDTAVGLGLAGEGGVLRDNLAGMVPDRGASTLPQRSEMVEVDIVTQCLGVFICLSFLLKALCLAIFVYLCLEDSLVLSLLLTFILSLHVTVIEE